MIKNATLLLLCSNLLFSIDGRKREVDNIIPDPFRYSSVGKIGDNPFPTNPMSDRAKGFIDQGRVKSAIVNYGSFINWDFHPSGIWGDYSYLPAVSFIGAVPGNKNTAAFTWQSLETIQDDENVKSVAVTAEGKVFCAGGDLREFKAAGEELPGVVEAMLEDLHDAIYMMNDIPKPFVAGIQGAAGGAGMSLVSAFDLVVSGESAKYTMAYTRVGLTPDGTSSYFLARHIGLRRMMDLTLTNRVLLAEEAESWGLVNRIVPDDDIEAQALKLAQQLADGAPNAAGIAKTVIYKGYESNLREAGDFEALNIVRSAGTRVGQEGIAAFVEKRDPEWNE